MADKPQFTRRALALLATTEAGLLRSVGAAQDRPQASEPLNPEQRLRRAADRLARCQVKRDTQPALQFLP